MEGVPIKILGRATLKHFGSVKPRANGRNIVGQAVLDRVRRASWGKNQKRLICI